MGGCLSRKKESSSLNVLVPVSLSGPNKLFDSATTPNNEDATEEKLKKNVIEKDKVKKEVLEEESLVKKEIFVIKHRSHDRERFSLPLIPNDAPLIEENNVDSACASVNSNNANEMGGSNVSNMMVRTSSCTKEEVDAILIQCGRLSRSNSSGAAGKAASSRRKYAGSKRSYDLDQEQDVDMVVAAAADYHARKKENGSYCNDDEQDEMCIAERRQHRQRHRQSGRPSPSSSSQGRRSTPSREREQRSGSRERGNGSSSCSGRRVSRSPGRRSETTPAPNSTTTNNRPGKMVSVPATVSSLTTDKSNIGIESQTAASIKRISVKRIAGETASRTAASPRSQSPARANARGDCQENNQQQQQQPSLSRSSSRKAEQSPYRRNPLGEIDPNSLACAQATGNNKINKTKTREAGAQVAVKEVRSQKPNAEANKVVSTQGPNNRTIKEQTVIVEEAKAQTEALKRSRSARRSRDLDFNPEILLNPNPSYTALLLEDIQNFHQKNTNTNTNSSSFSVPPCVAKACSILESVADLNSTTNPNLSCNTGVHFGKKPTVVKDPFVESEIVVSDHLMEPSLHKYVTVRRGGNGPLCGEDMDGQESSGSNSFVGGSQHHWVYSTSSEEPNSADSTDRLTSKSNTRGDEKNPLGLQKHMLSEPGHVVEDTRKGFGEQRIGIGRGRDGSSKNLLSTPLLAANASA